MTHSKQEIIKSDSKENNPLQSTRRGTLLGMLGLAGLGLSAKNLSAKSSDATHTSNSHTVCDGTGMDINDYLAQFQQPLPEAIKAKEGLAKVGSAKLWYRDTGGDGDAIVLVHPSNLSGHGWAYQEKAFSEAGFRVISYSRRGYKGSDAGLPTDSSDAVDDLAGLVKYLDIQSFHIVSAAGGGAVGAGYAARFADDERLKSLIIACSMAMFEKSLDAGGTSFFRKAL